MTVGYSVFRGDWYDHRGHVEIKGWPRFNELDRIVCDLLDSEDYTHSRAMIGGRLKDRFESPNGYAVLFDRLVSY